MKKIKEDDFGFLEWISTSEGSGFWSRVEDPEMTSLRTPEVCPACSQGLDRWAIENFYHRTGVCSDCAILYLENPSDGKWISRFPEGFFKTRNDKVEWCKQKIADKLKNQ